jgi:hypothetical protein
LPARFEHTKRITRRLPEPSSCSSGPSEGVAQMLVALSQAVTPAQHADRRQEQERLQLGSARIGREWAVGQLKGRASQAVGREAELQARVERLGLRSPRPSPRKMRSIRNHLANMQVDHWMAAHKLVRKVEVPSPQPPRPQTPSLPPPQSPLPRSLPLLTTSPFHLAPFAVYPLRPSHTLCSGVSLAPSQPARTV